MHRIKIILIFIFSLVMAGLGVADDEKVDKRLLGIVVAYSVNLEARALKEGRPLTAVEKDIAVEMGVKYPDKVRVLVVPSLGEPEDAYYHERMRAFGRPAGLGRATAKGYGVVIREDSVHMAIILPHELVHVGQYERLGGIEPAQKLYLRQLEEFGYSDTPLENEAYDRAREWLAKARMDKESN
ncbi:MAG: hypothetical protein MJA83_11795 [Gammaproteobacteria bacterium]|nr:hypothetical protein [Gammaproteobacteria bacterium]